MKIGQTVQQLAQCFHTPVYTALDLCNTCTCTCHYIHVHVHVHVQVHTCTNVQYTVPDSKYASPDPLLLDLHVVHMYKELIIVPHLSDLHVHIKYRMEIEKICMYTYMYKQQKRDSTFITCTCISVLHFSTLLHLKWLLNAQYQ